jgi:hypothetical protein
MSLVSKSFSDIVTFSRSSNATRIGPTGRVEYAPHNLATYSEQFDNAAWIVNNATITANAVLSPSGTVTADKITEDTSNTDHKVRQAVTFTSVPQTYSAYLKAAERTCGALQIYDGSTLFGYIFDLSTGTLGSRVSGSSTSVTGSITSVGNGWYRCAITFTPAAAGGQFNVGIASNTTTVTYTGDGTSGIYLWGAQLSVGPYPLDYTPTTSAAVYGPRFDYDPVTLAARGLLVEESRTNLLLYSEQFDNAAWDKVDSTITSNSVASPDGTISADTLTQSATGVARVRQIQTLTSSQPYTLSCFAKAGTSNYIALIYSETNWECYAKVNLATGAIVEAGNFFGRSTYLSSSITALANGWYRITLSFNAAAGAATDYVHLNVTNSASWSSSTNPSDTTSAGSVYIWGAQCE